MRTKAPPRRCQSRIPEAIPSLLSIPDAGAMPSASEASRRLGNGRCAEPRCFTSFSMTRRGAHWIRPAWAGLRRGRALSQHDIQAHRDQSTLHCQLHLVARFVLEQRPDHRELISDALEIDRGEDVPDLNADLLRGAARHDFLDVEPFLYWQRPLHDGLLA